MDDRLAELIAMHHDGDLDEAGQLELIGRLEVDPAARAAFRRELRLTIGLCQEAALRRAASQPRRGWLRLALPAAVLAAAAGLALAVLQPTPSPVAPVSTPVGVVPASASVPGPPADALVFAGRPTAIGETLRDGGTLSWPDGSTAELGTDAVLRLETGVRRGVLLAGSMAVTVAHQKPGYGFAVDAGPARAHALGTRFRLDTGQRGTRVSVTDGVVALFDGDESRLAHLLFPGDTWWTASTWAAGHISRNQAVIAAARQSSRVEQDILFDMSFGEGERAQAKDRAGGSLGMVCELVPGMVRWDEDGMSVVAPGSISWRGGGAPLRAAVATSGLTIEVAWTGTAIPDRAGCLLEFGGELEEEAIAVVAPSENTLRHVVWRLGADGLSIIGNGDVYRRLGDPGSEAVARSYRILNQDRLVLMLRGISYSVADHKSGRADRQAGEPWQVTYRRVTIYGRALTFEEIRRNASSALTADTP